MAKKPKGKPRPRQKYTPTRKYLGHELKRAIYMAGEGMSASEIAIALGGTTAVKIRSLLSKHGISLKRRGGYDDRIVVRCTTPEREAITAFAERFDMEAGPFMLRLAMEATAKHIHDVFEDGGDA
ncbi:hypothetical protein [Microvirga brassicacearum]|uniref:Uncharacterized protein n=1 Tax=Microvirga brassicacearum TaxID=2580413 RepID=A0A5N3PH18_9HYPH|nr:hypothetical protein [Microvirga brassicacearum]KAB0269009.1 hypothetical protein FEZ63_02565 [Microvirga brassicacearum]